jgi:hypothetical protein
MKKMVPKMIPDRSRAQKYVQKIDRAFRDENQR